MAEHVLQGKKEFRATDYGCHDFRQVMVGAGCKLDRIEWFGRKKCFVWVPGDDSERWARCMLSDIFSADATARKLFRMRDLAVLILSGVTEFSARSLGIQRSQMYSLKRQAGLILLRHEIIPVSGHCINVYGLGPDTAVWAKRRARGPMSPKERAWQRRLKYLRDTENAVAYRMANPRIEEPAEIEPELDRHECSEALEWVRDQGNEVCAQHYRGSKVILREALVANGYQCVDPFTATWRKKSH